MGHGPVSRRLILPISVAVILGAPGVPALAADPASAVSAGGMPAIPAGPVPAGAGQTSPQDVAVTVDAAKKAVMDAFGIPQTDGMTFSYSFETGGPDGRRLWNLGWQMPPRANGGGEGFNASVDADSGAIVSYQHWRDAERPLPPSVSRDQARETAKALIEKLQPQQFRETVEWPAEDVYGPLGVANYVFSFVRVHNGIPFPMDGFHVVVGKDGQIVSYQFGWSNVSFPDAQPSLSREEAQSKLAEALAVTAHYMPDPGKWVGRAQVRMVYTANVVPPSFSPGSPYLSIPSYVLDASTGQWIDGFGKQASKPAVSSADPLVPGGPVAPPLRNQPIDQAGAEAIARSLPDIGKDAVLRSSHLDDGAGRQHPVWIFEFALSDNSVIHVGVDALTEEVISLNRGGPVPLAEGKTDREEPAVTPEQARQIVVDFLKQVLPNRLGALVLPDNQPDNPVVINGKILPAGTIVKPPFLQNYVFDVRHLHNGVIDDLSNVAMSVDKKTGRVTSYYARFADDPGVANGVTYPEGRPKSADEAKKAYLDAVQMTLAYIRLRDNPDDPQQWGPVRLVYLPVSATTLIGWDAFSGEWIRPYSVPGAGLNFEEINGHWAEKELKAMLQAGVLQPVGGKIAPDEPMTRGDFVAALSRAVAPYAGAAPDKPSFRDVPPDHPDYPYIEWALQRGWIDPGPEFHPDAPLTRIAMADMIVRELGYQDLTQGKGIFQNPYSDMEGRSDREVGDAAIVTGLGIMRGSDGKFLPDEPASRAEAAVALYNLLAVHHP